MTSPARLLFRLRVEEAIALAFLLPTTYLTLVAEGHARRLGILGERYLGGPSRLVVAAVFLFLLAAARWLRPRSPWVLGVREILPFFVCILIYTNLHDTVGFVNPHDIHHYLAALDVQIFGVLPCVWAERFITPARTQAMTLLYMNFLWIAPSTAVLLLIRRRWREFRTTAMGILTCFYVGYFCYLAFPAAVPAVVQVYDFRKSLEGYPRLLSNLSARAFELLPENARDAFPSLHAAVSLLALVYAWRFLRPWFWTLLPFVLGLWVSTIYLRQHYVVDLIAGWILAPLALRLAPPLDAWWSARQRALGYEPPRGAL